MEKCLCYVGDELAYRPERKKITYGFGWEVDNAHLVILSADRSQQAHVLRGNLRFLH